MAQIVGGIGVPHTPYFPRFAVEQGPDGEIERFFAPVREALEADRPDVLVMVDTDHFNTFFLNNFPTFGVGVDDSFYGPIDDVAHCPPRTIASHKGLAEAIFGGLIRRDFDPALVTHYSVGHSLVVPLHFLLRNRWMPIIPIFLNGHLPPMPSAARSLAFGRAMREIILGWPENLRIVVIGTGSFSLDVAGPRMEPGKNFGVPDQRWANRVQALMEAGDIDALVEEATEDQMLEAGNVGGEVLNWIAMIGAVGETRAKWINAQPERGHAYGVWPGREP